MHVVFCAVVFCTVVFCTVVFCAVVFCAVVRVWNATKRNRTQQNATERSTIDAIMFSHFACAYVRICVEFDDTQSTQYTGHGRVSVIPQK